MPIFIKETLLAATARRVWDFHMAPGALERLDVLLHVASESPLRQLQREVEALCADPGTRQEQLQRMKEAADRAMKELTGIAHELRLAQRGKPHG